MTSLTLSVSNKFREDVKRLSWINWSEIAREEALKKIIFENYMKSGTITDEEWEFCEQIDWHPVDELPLREDYKKELENRKKGPFLKVKTISEIFKE